MIDDYVFVKVDHKRSKHNGMKGTVVGHAFDIVNVKRTTEPGKPLHIPVVVYFVSLFDTVGIEALPEMGLKVIPDDGVKEKIGDDMYASFLRLRLAHLEEQKFYMECNIKAGVAGKLPMGSSMEKIREALKSSEKRIGEVKQLCIKANIPFHLTK